MKYLLVVVALVFTVESHPTFQGLIPNGDSVPNPCGGGYWGPVGHYSPTSHTIDKNPFGLAFLAANYTWTSDLCQADSDKDGHSNGQELGDPTCVWVKGATPTHKATGQPGICEPIGSTKCQSQAFVCGCTGSACVGR